MSYPSGSFASLCVVVVCFAPLDHLCCMLVTKAEELDRGTVHIEFISFETLP